MVGMQPVIEKEFLYLEYLIDGYRKRWTVDVRTKGSKGSPYPQSRGTTLVKVVYFYRLAKRLESFKQKISALTVSLHFIEIVPSPPFNEIYLLSLSNWGIMHGLISPHLCPAVKSFVPLKEWIPGNPFFFDWLRNMALGSIQPWVLTE